MSATTPTLTKQKELANKRKKDLEDHEKIFLLKREIDNLRSQIRDTGAVTGVGHVGPDDYQSPQSSSSSSLQGTIDQQRGGFFHRIPTLSLFLIVGIAMIVRWRKRQRTSHLRSTFMNSMAASDYTMPEISMNQFELQDAHDETSASRRNYEAPLDDAATTATIQFV